MRPELPQPADHLVSRELLRCRPHDILRLRREFDFQSLRLLGEVDARAKFHMERHERAPPASQPASHHPQPFSGFLPSLVVSIPVRAREQRLGVRSPEVRKNEN